jgi:transcriptional regulator with GAF, ATPase, and Fis domain
VNCGALPPNLVASELFGYRKGGKQRGDLIALLTTHAGNVSAVSRALGRERVQVQRWLKRFGIDVRAFRR